MEEKTQKPNNRKRKMLALIVFTLMAIIGLIATIIYIQYKKTHITTDNAFIDGDIYTIASKIPGTVKAIHVDTNQFVKKGTLLLEIDPVDYEVKIKEANAGVNAEKARLSEIDARITAEKTRLSELVSILDVAKANLEMVEATMRQAESDKNRAENLYKKDSISKERYEKAMTEYLVSVARFKSAKEELNRYQKAIETQKSVIKQVEVLKNAQSSLIKEKEAKLNTAELNYSYTKIYAPSDGYITKKSVEVGNQIQTGQPLMAIVSLDDIYVTANYKETQLERVKPGQRVKIKVDTYPGKVFWGKVDSIMAGTGAVFSLFPPENATGNYVKVVQRIPVKIVFEKNSDPEHILRIGMSVVPTILIEKE